MSRFVLAAAAALQVAVSAEVPAGAATPPTSEALAQMCGANGALGFAFGATGAPYSSRLENMLGLRPALGTEFAPFVRMETRATPWSGRLAFVTYELPMAEGGEAEALRDALAEAFEAAGWRRNAGMEDFGSLPLYLAPLGGERVYEAPGDGQVVASFGQDLGAFALVCGHKGLLRENAEEALGNLPPGTPRPQAPPLPEATNRTAADCDRPEVQRDMLTIVDGRASNPIAQLLHRASHAERLAQWKQWRLRSSGRVSPDRLLELTVGALESGSPGGDPLAAFELFPEMLDAIERLAAQTEARQSAAACRTSFELVEIFRRMEAITAPQWRALDAALEAEARRQGISFD